MLPRLALLIPALAAPHVGCGARPEPAELVLLGGRLVTLDPSRPEARALAARGGLIVAVGDESEVRRHVGPSTRVIDLEGRLAIPGFIEGHGHFTGLGRSLAVVALGGAKSWPEVVERVERAAAKTEPGRWLVGRGWHQEKWDAHPADAVLGYPTHDLLSRAVPDHPVLLVHASGHAALVNTRALESSGIDARTPDPAGGRIVRDRNGRPTGVLLEAAESLALAAQEGDVARRTAAEREADARAEIERADRECLARGVTSFQDAGSDLETVARFEAVAEERRLGVRLWVMLGDDDDALAPRLGEFPIVGAGDAHLTVRAIKRYIDGALGTHGAWLLEPYADEPANTGLNRIPLDALERTAELALAHGLQLCVHAIGDRGNRETLDLYQRVFERHPEAKDLRWRIEHVQHLAPADVPRFATLGVIASMQAIHCTSDAPWVPLRLGARRSEEGAYVWRKLIDSGATVSNGTDTPVESVDPILNFHAAVTRRAPGEGAVAFHPEQRMTRLEALRAATILAARAAFEDGIKGTLEPGKLADVTVLSRDILEVPEEQIPGTEVAYTIVGGRVLFERKNP